MIQLIFLITSVWGSHSHGSADSLRIETIEGQQFVIHQVDPKETLYGISKRYHASIDEILKYNNNADTGLSVGQILKIPFKKPSSRSSGKYHEVQLKETLGSIAALYGLSEGQLRALNKLTNATVSVGQKLLINKLVNQAESQTDGTPQKVPKGFHKVASGETLYALSSRYNTTVRSLKRWNNITGSALNVGQVIRVSGPSSEEKKDNSAAVKNPPTVNKKTEKSPVNKKNTSIGISEKVAGASEIKESGLVELIEGSIAKRKYLALHRTASKGAILKVRNTSNNHEIFVRVIGPLPPDEAKNGVIIKVSKSAFDQLGGKKNALKAEITYYK